MAMHSEGPMHASAYYPAHDFYGWLGVSFPWVYGLSEIDDGVRRTRLWHFSRKRMATLSFEEATERILALNQQTQRIFRFSPIASDEDEERTRDEVLTLRETEFAMSVQSCLLPLREGVRFLVEPYLPYRFARQFGLDQGVPPPPPRVSREEREVGVGPAFWPSLWARFTHLRTRCRIFLPGRARLVRITYMYGWWYSGHGCRVRKPAPPESEILIFPPFDAEFDYTNVNWEDHLYGLRLMFSEVPPRSPGSCYWISERLPRQVFRRNTSLLDWTGEGVPVRAYEVLQGGDFELVYDEIPPAPRSPTSYERWRLKHRK